MGKKEVRPEKDFIPHCFKWKRRTEREQIKKRKKGNDKEMSNRVTKEGATWCDGEMEIKKDKKMKRTEKMELESMRERKRNER